MSDSDADLFGSGDEGAAKVSPAPGSGTAAAGGDGDDSDAGLFGSDDENEGSSSATSKVAVGGLAGLDDEDMGNTDRAVTEEDKLTAILGVNKSEKDSAGSLHMKPRTSGKLYLPTAPAFAEDSAEKLYVRVPEVLRIQTGGYVKQSYDAEEEIKEFMVSVEKRGKLQTTEAIISDVIRWRQKVDSNGAPVMKKDGQPEMESNARLQKLKSGGFRVVIGDSVFDAPTAKIARSYVFGSSQSRPPADAVLSAEEGAAGVSLNSSTNLKCVANLEGSYRMNLQAHESNTMASAVMQQGNKSRFGVGGPRIKQEDSRKIVERPEVVAERQLREEEARLRAAKKARESERGGGGGDSGRGNGDYGRIGMSSDYLTADGEEQTQFDDINIGDIKKGRSKRDKSQRGTRKAAAYEDPSDDEDMDDDDDDIGSDSGSDSGSDDSDSPAEKSKGKKLHGKRKTEASDDGSDIDDNMFLEEGEKPAADDEEDDEEAGPVKKRARQNVVDDDDDDE